MGTTNDVNPNPLDMSGWTTVFFDGFNGSSLDRSKWPITYGGSTYWNGAFVWDNSQVGVGNGELTIGLDAIGNGMWSAGGLSTAPYDGAPSNVGFSFTYGRVEIRAKASQEVWGAGPCFLLWPADLDTWPPEIDILETPKGQGMFTNHWQGPGGNNDDRYASHFFDLDYSQWHTYTLDWLPGRLTLYVDGVEVYTTTENIPDIAMSVGLQGHVGTASDGWYGSPNGSGVNSVDISVDWVRVSQYTAGGTPPVSAPTTPPATPAPPVTSPVTPAAGKALTGTSGSDTLAGGDGADTLSGAAGADTLAGGKGDDRLTGGAGYDVLTLGDGADTLVFARGDGEDYVVDFKPGTDKIQLAGFAKADVTLKSWASGTDLLLSSGEKLWLAGVTALGTNDILYTNIPTPPTTPTTPTTGKALTGTAGNDTLTGTAGPDTLKGAAGNDLLQGGAGNDQLSGGKGTDTLTLGTGRDTVTYARGDGTDRLTDFTAGEDKLSLSGLTTSEVSLRATAEGLQLDIADGGKILLAGTKAVKAGDITIGTTALPALSTTLPTTSKTVTGTTGHDDGLKGSSGADLLLGGLGSDDLHGLDGNDILRGGKDHDGLTLGAGRDIVAFARGDGPDWVVDFTPGEDRLWLEGISPASLTQTIEQRWEYTGLALDLGQGDEIFLQGITTTLTTPDILFA